MQMCPECERIYDESDYAHCPYCSGEMDPNAYDDEEEYDTEDLENYEDLNLEYVYDEDGNSVSCPTYGCRCEELRWRDGECFCPECETTFSDEEIED